MTRVHVALLLGLAVALGVVLWRAPSSSDALAPSRPGERALSILLPDAAMVATLDVEALDESPWGRAVLSGLAGLAGPAGQRGCAEQQLRVVRAVAIGLPFARGERAMAEVALVAEGPFEERAVIHCASELMKARARAPAASRVNDYAVLRARRGTGELAVKNGGPLIVSGGDYFRDLLEREGGGGGGEPGVTEELHRALRARAGSSPLLATWLLPPGWLERWLEDPELGGSPLGSIRAVVMRGRAGRELALDIRFSTEDAGAAERLEPFLRRLVGGAASFLSDGSARPPVVTRAGETIVVELSTEGFDAARALGALRMLGGGPSAASHALDRADAEQIQPDAERAAGGRAQ